MVDVVVLNFYLFLFSSVILRSKMKFIFQLVNKNLQNSSCYFRKYKSVFFQILHQSWVQSNKSPPHFFGSSIIYYGQKQPIKVQIFSDFQVLDSKFIKLLMSILNWQLNSSSNFASLFILMTHNSPVNFTLIYFLVWIKAPKKRLNF